MECSWAPALTEVLGMAGLIKGVRHSAPWWSMGHQACPLECSWGPALTMVLAMAGSTKPAPSPYFLKLACAYSC